ncbi:MAG: SDR family NAD(P)-dependent oxidoreductase [Comamonadaceae bacterium]|nr:MAG: SDR family NAD(P)-dependent oxidoreductase [Comamonadaceae bacterium]
MSKVWFITGSGRGIGAEIAKAALNAGDSVVVTGRSIARLQEAYGGYGDRALPLELDIAREADSFAAAEAALKRFGRIDVLVNNAGYGQLGLFEEVASGEVERQFQTNVFGMMHATRAVLPGMRHQRSGHILNLASVGGFMGFENASIYCAAKFAVEGFSESLALEVAPFGINVTVVEPGFFRTDFLDKTSVRYGSKTIADYEAVSTASRSTYDHYNHQQPGDPAKLGRVMVEIAAMDQPPLHFVAGSDGLSFARSTFARRADEVEAHAALSATTDGDF